MSVRDLIPWGRSSNQAPLCFATMIATRFSRCTAR